MMYDTQQREREWPHEKHRSSPPHAALAGPTPLPQHAQALMSAARSTSVVDFQSRSKLRLAVLADHVSAHGNGATRRDVDRLLTLVALNQIAVSDAHEQLAQQRRDQQQRAA